MCQATLKGDANPLTYSITSDVKKERKTKIKKKEKRTKQQTSKIKQQIRHDSTLEVNNTLFNDKWK